MVKKKLVYGLAALLLTGCGLTGLMGCGNKATAEGRTEIEIVSYKKEAVDTFNKIAARFNETHDDIHLTIDSPNEAMTILKTRFIREDYPDIIVIGGDMDYSNFLDAGLFADISKVFTEKQIDITSMNVRTSKQGRATIIMTFDIHGTEELNRITDKIRQIDGVLDIQRTTG